MSESATGVQTVLQDYSSDKGNGAPLEYRNPETLRRLYHEEGLSLPQVGDRLGVSTQTIAGWMKKHGIPTRPSPANGPPSISVVGGGYLQVECQYKGKRENFYLHKLVAVAEYGFEVVAKADLVHHRNGHRLDNRPSNLEPLSYSEHIKRHNKYDGSSEII